MNEILLYLWKYLIGPIVADAKNAETAVWNEVTAQVGYNPVNTIVWGLLAALVVYSIFKVFKKYEIEFNMNTVVYSTPFILLGGVLRFLEDAAVLPFGLRLLLITPIIYIVITGAYLACIVIAERLSSDIRERNNNFLYIGSIILLAPLIYATTLVLGSSSSLWFLAFILVISGSLTGLAYLFLNETSLDHLGVYLAVFGQFFGGAVSMGSVMQGYTQKQIVAQFSTQLFGAPGILLVKTALLAIALYVISDTDDEFSKAMIVLVLTVIGLGTGLRVLLRTMAGI